MSDVLPPLDPLNEKLKALRARREEPASAAPTSGAGLAMRLGTELAAAVLVGGGIGYFLDRWLNSVPLFLILCLILGMAAGFLNMYRANQRIMREMQAREDANGAAPNDGPGAQ